MRHREGRGVHRAVNLFHDTRLQPHTDDNGGAYLALGPFGHVVFMCAAGRAPLKRTRYTPQSLPGLAKHETLHPYGSPCM